MGKPESPIDVELHVITVWQEDGQPMCDLGSVSVLDATNWLAGILANLSSVATPVTVKRGKTVINKTEWRLFDDDTDDDEAGTDD